MYHLVFEEFEKDGVISQEDFITAITEAETLDEASEMILLDKFRDV
jgi:hypothetical protein